MSVVEGKLRSQQIPTLLDPLPLPVWRHIIADKAVVQISKGYTGSRGDEFGVRTSKPVENLWKKWVILIALQFRYKFYWPQTKRLRARKIGLQYNIRKGRKQIWGRFSNPWNSNWIEWNRLTLPTWSRIFMYLPNTVGKRHKKAFKFIFGDRNLRLRDSAFVRYAQQQMVTEIT